MKMLKALFGKKKASQQNQNQNQKQKQSHDNSHDDDRPSATTAAASEKRSVFDGQCLCHRKHAAAKGCERCYCRSVDEPARRRMLQQQSAADLAPFLVSRESISLADKLHDTIFGAVYKGTLQQSGGSEAIPVAVKHFELRPLPAPTSQTNPTAAAATLSYPLQPRLLLSSYNNVLAAEAAEAAAAIHSANSARTKPTNGSNTTGSSSSSSKPKASLQTETESEPIPNIETATAIIDRCRAQLTARCQKELAILCGVRHANIVAGYAGCLQYPNLLLAYQHFPYSLDDVLQGRLCRRMTGDSDVDSSAAELTLTFAEKVTLARDIANAVAHLHSNNIVAVSLQSSAILIDERSGQRPGTAKLSDFSMARIVVPEAPPHLMLPDQLQHQLQHRHTRTASRLRDQSTSANGSNGSGSGTAATRTMSWAEFTESKANDVLQFAFLMHELFCDVALLPLIRLRRVDCTFRPSLEDTTLRPHEPANPAHARIIRKQFSRVLLLIRSAWHRNAAIRPSFASIAALLSDILRQLPPSTTTTTAAAAANNSKEQSSTDMVVEWSRLESVLTPPPNATAMHRSRRMRAGDSTASRPFSMAFGDLRRSVADLSQSFLFAVSPASSSGDPTAAATFEDNSRSRVIGGSVLRLAAQHHDLQQQQQHHHHLDGRSKPSHSQQQHHSSGGADGSGQAAANEPEPLITYLTQPQPRNDADTDTGGSELQRRFSRALATDSRTSTANTRIGRLLGIDIDSSLQSADPLADNDSGASSPSLFLLDIRNGGGGGDGTNGKKWRWPPRMGAGLEFEAVLLNERASLRFRQWLSDVARSAEHIHFLDAVQDYKSLHFAVTAAINGFVLGGLPGANGSSGGGLNVVGSGVVRVWSCGQAVCERFLRPTAAMQINASDALKHEALQSFAVQSLHSQIQHQQQQQQQQRRRSLTGGSLTANDDIGADTSVDLIGREQFGLPSSTVFDGLYAHVYYLLRTDLFPRYVASLV